LRHHQQAVNIIDPARELIKNRIICTFLSAIISIVLIFRVTISLGKVKGYWGGIRGLFVVLVTLGIFMPTLGKSNSSMYRAKAYSVVYPALRQFNDNPQVKELITYDKLRTFVIRPSGLGKFRESFQAGR